MSSPFKQCAAKLGLQEPSAGTSQNHHWAALLLTALGDVDEQLGPASVTFSGKPAQEVLLRLQAYNGLAAQELRRILNSQVLVEAQS